LSFRDWNTLNNPAVGYRRTVSDAATQVWEVTDPFNPVKMVGSLSANSLQFSNDALRLREYMAFSSSAFPLPKVEGKVAPQNLHATSEADYLIITATAFLTQAERLAGFHRQRENLRVAVVTTEQVLMNFQAVLRTPPLYGILLRCILIVTTQPGLPGVNTSCSLARGPLTIKTG
jgi:hypothetical protein